MIAAIAWSTVWTSFGLDGLKAETSEIVITAGRSGTPQPKAAGTTTVSQAAHILSRSSTPPPSDRSPTDHPSRIPLCFMPLSLGEVIQQQPG
jgi:hypothetical protein